MSQHLDPLTKQVGGEHYSSLLIQPIEYIISNKLSWCEGNAIKYITRHKTKGQRKDIEKAIHYLELLLELEYGDDQDPKNYFVDELALSIEHDNDDGGGNRP